jgi:hypothetical protein
MSKAALIEDIRRDFTSKELFYAILADIGRKHGRDILALYGPVPPEPELTEEGEACVDKVLRLGTLRQLKGLRKIALELEGGVEQ